MDAGKLEEVQGRFAEFLPDIQRITGSVLSGRDPESREEAVAEVTAQCWMNWLHLACRDRDVTPGSLAHYGMLAVRSVRSLAGSNSTDVLSPRTRMLGRSRVQSFDAAPCPGSADGDDSADGSWDCSWALADNRLWENPLERTRVKLDYGAFLRRGGLNRQERRVFRMLARGHTTGEMAAKLGVSAPRVCQIKKALGEKLVRFMGTEAG